MNVKISIKNGESFDVLGQEWQTAGHVTQNPFVK